MEHMTIRQSDGKREDQCNRSETTGHIVVIIMRERVTVLMKQIPCRLWEFKILQKNCLLIRTWS